VERLAWILPGAGWAEYEVQFAFFHDLANEKKRMLGPMRLQRTFMGAKYSPMNERATVASPLLRVLHICSVVDDETISCHLTTTKRPSTTSSPITLVYHRHKMMHFMWLWIHIKCNG
jgi:hypothetical protein